MDSQSRKNIAWINSAKSLCIILVYFFHTEFYVGFNAEDLHNLYVAFYTNGFFFISGYLLFKKQLSDPIIRLSRIPWINSEGKRMLSNILYRIALPTILFSVVMFVPKTLLRGNDFIWHQFADDTILGGSIWFTCALTIAEILIFLSYYIVKLLYGCILYIHSCLHL